MAFSKRLPTLNHHASSVVERCENTEGLKRPRLLPQQISALHDVRKFFVSGSGQNDIALVSMPTGTGKTGVIACLPYYLATVSDESNTLRYLFDKPILVIAPGLDIFNQLKQQLTVIDANNKLPFLIRTDIVPFEDHPHVLPKPLVIQQTSEVNNQEYLRTFDIVIANAQKFLADNWEKRLDKNLFRLIIVDEAHHHPAPTWRRIVEKFHSPDCPVVFFTATPYRTDGQLVLPSTETCIAHHLNLKDAVEGGIIRKTEFEQLSEIEPNVDGFLKNPEAHTSKAKEHMERMIPILRRVNALLKEKRSTVPDVPHMAIAIARNTNYAEYLLELWQTLFPEEPAESYYSNKNENEKTSIMEQLVNNELSLVIVVAMLLEGFDHPPISIAAITCNIKSPVRFVQFIGRAQRVYRRDGYTDKLSANIVTHVNYEQRRNYDNFIKEALIPQTEDENDDDN